MKIKKLLVLSALWLLGLNANAAVDGNVWQKPALPEGVAMELDVEYYFLNVGSGLFFTQGNAYGTQASAGNDGLKVKIAQSGSDYTLTDSVKTQKAWKMWWFVDDINNPSMYVDYNNQENFLWTITEVGGNVYRFSPSLNNPYTSFAEGMFAGLDRTKDAKNTALTWNNTADGGAFIDWKLVPAETFNMDEFAAAMGIYDAAMTLKETLDKAEEIGANVTEQIAVYNNTASTKDELTAANTAALEIIAQREKELIVENYDKATAESPVVVTDLHITNPSYDSNKNTGWEGSPDPGFQSYTNAEFYQKVFETKQTIANLKEGVYALGVQAFYRPGNATDGYSLYTSADDQIFDVKMFATMGSDTLTQAIVTPYPEAGTEKVGIGNESGVETANGSTIYIPNNMQAAEAYFVQADRYHNTLFFDAMNGSSIIGMKNSKSIGANWVIYDNWSLTYYGKGADAYQLWSDRMLATIKIEVAEGILYTPAYATALTAATTGKTATNKAEVLANLAAAEQALADAKNNMRLWKEWEALVNEGQALKGEGNYDLDDYVEYDASEIKEACTLTNEELNAEIAKLVEWIEQAQMKVTPGTDVTNMYLKNADFEKGNEGWLGSGSVTAFANGEVEAYEKNPFDLYQIVTKAPKGVYSITLQGFYRGGSNDNAYAEYKSAKASGTKLKEVAWVYLNNNTSPLLNVYTIEGDERISGDRATAGTNANAFYVTNSGPAAWTGTDNDGNEWSFPNGMGSAHDCFEAGMYQSTAYGLVLNNGDEIRIGIKGNLESSNWAIWDNFKLVYEGYTADVVKPVLEEQIAAAKTKANEKMGKDVKEALTATIAEAEAAAAGTDGEAMFNALVKISDINPDASIEKFKNLQTRNEELATAAEEATICAISTITEARALNQQITSGIEAGTYTDADVEDLLAQITSMIKKLGIPEDMENATDANPMDATTIIINPDYDKGNNDGWTLDANPGFNKGLIEVYNANFDEYQDLENLPAGTYEVSVQGFYRFGDGVRDDSTYTQAPTDNNNLLLYVTVGENSIHVPMPRLAKDGKQEYTSFTKSDDGKSFIAGDDIEEAGDRWQWMWLGTPVADADSISATGYRLANGMVPVSILFEEGKFSGTSIIFTVGAEGKARIGLKKIVQEDKNWCIWDNWKLTYYGANSAKTPTVDGIVSASAAAAAKVEFFGLNGARISKPTKGVAIMRQTMSDGTVKTSKVIIK